MSATHTPGPWRVNKDLSAVVGKEGRVCEVTLQTAPTLNRPQSFHDERQMANARLIASSPGLLDACRALLSLVEGKDPQYMFDTELQAAVVMARAAVAKATGEEKP